MSLAKSQGKISTHHTTPYFSPSTIFHTSFSASETFAPAAVAQLFTVPHALSAVSLAAPSVLSKPAAKLPRLSSDSRCSKLARCAEDNSAA